MVIAIIGVLASLILPAVQSSRRAAKRAECLNNIRNLGIAFQNFHGTHNKLPAAGYWDVASSNPKGATDDEVAAGYDFTIDAPESKFTGLRYSWVVGLLPFIERNDLYQKYDFSEEGQMGSAANSVSGLNPKGGNNGIGHASIKVLTCPEDPTLVPGRGNLSYVANGGVHYHWFAKMHQNGTPDGIVGDEEPPQIRARMQDNIFKQGLMFTMPAAEGSSKAVSKRHSFATVQDGLTNTILLTENINAGVSSQGTWGGSTANWALAHPFNTSFFIVPVCDPQNDCASPYPPIDEMHAPDSWRWNDINKRGDAPWTMHEKSTNATYAGGINNFVAGQFEGIAPFPNSGHGGGVHVAFCDGSAKLISENISALVYAKLVSPAGTMMVRPTDGKWQRAALEGVSCEGHGWTQEAISEEY